MKTPLLRNRSKSRDPIGWSKHMLQVAHTPEFADKFLYVRQGWKWILPLVFLMSSLLDPITIARADLCLAAAFGLICHLVPHTSIMMDVSVAAAILCSEIIFWRRLSPDVLVLYHAYTIIFLIIVGIRTEIAYMLIASQMIIVLGIFGVPCSSVFVSGLASLACCLCLQILLAKMVIHKISNEALLKFCQSGHFMVDTGSARIMDVGSTFSSLGIEATCFAELPQYGTNVSLLDLIELSKASGSCMITLDIPSGRADCRLIPCLQTSSALFVCWVLEGEVRPNSDIGTFNDHTKIVVADAECHNILESVVHDGDTSESLMSMHCPIHWRVGEEPAADCSFCQRIAADRRVPLLSTSWICPSCGASNTVWGAPCNPSATSVSYHSEYLLPSEALDWFENELTCPPLELLERTSESQGMQLLQAWQPDLFDEMQDMFEDMLMGHSVEAYANILMPVAQRRHTEEKLDQLYYWLIVGVQCRTRWPQLDTGNIWNSIIEYLIPAQAWLLPCGKLYWTVRPLAIEDVPFIVGHMEPVLRLFLAMRQVFRGQLRNTFEPID